MPTFRITVAIRGTREYRVEADSAEEALDKYERGDGEAKFEQDEIDEVAGAAIEDVEEV